MGNSSFAGLPVGTAPREEGCHEVLKRIGGTFAELIDQDRSAAYRYLRKEIAANLHILIRAEEIGSLRDWVMALQKVEEALGGDSAEDLEYPLDKIAKMLNESQ